MGVVQELSYGPELFAVCWKTRTGQGTICAGRFHVIRGDVGHEERTMASLNELRSRYRHEARAAQRVWIEEPGKL